MKVWSSGDRARGPARFVRLMRPTFALLALLLALPTAAQQEPIAPGRGQSLPDTLEAIQQARVVTRVLFIVAHPDDEAGTLLTYLPHALGTDTTLLTLTRGEGGQNAIGPEQGRQLAMLRSAELLGAMEVEGPHLLFTRSPDFGFSKTLEETLEFWRATTLADMVRVIRTVRPNIVVNGFAGTHTGHGNHQASGYLTPKAVEAAADSSQFPEQLAEGLKPWRAEMILDPVRGPDADYTGAWVVPADEISPIWGRSYKDLANEGLLHHRSQGVTPFLNSPFARMRYALKRSAGGTLSGDDLARRLPALARALPVAGEPVLAAADRELDRARLAAENLDWSAAVRAIAEAGKQIAALEQQVKDSRSAGTPDALWELGQVRDRIDHALADAAAISIVANAGRSELVAGETFPVRVEVRQRQLARADASAPAVSLLLPAGWKVTNAEEKDGATNFTVTIPPGAQNPQGPADWMYPFAPPLVRARVQVETEGYAFNVTAPVQSREAATSAILTYPLRLVPPFTLSVQPEQFVIVEGRQPKQLEVFARVHSYSQAPAKVTVGLDVPVGWKAPEPVVVEFLGQGDRLARLRVTPAERIASGDFAVQAYAQRGAEKFVASLEPLPSLPWYLWSAPAKIPVHAFAIAVPDHLRVGYVAAGNDPIPEALGRLGIEVEMLDANGLAFADLGRFDAIVVGLRAYDLRADVPASNARLLDYAARGGTLVVQDQRPQIWDKLQPAPFAAKMDTGPRITDENAVVKFTDPASSLLNFPNKIGERDFAGWVQERGLYFWSQWDPQYHTVLAMHDPGEPDLTGGLLWAHTGKGFYIYTGLSFSRQLPLGNAGAFRLFVNLLSQSRSTARK